MSPAARTLAVYVRESRLQILSTLRTPQFLLPSVALPVMFYALFGVALAGGHERPAHWLLATYAVFAAIAPSLFGLGAGVAAEREAGLLALKRVSPAPSGAYLVSKLAAAMATTGLALLLIFAAAALAGVSMPLWRWLAIFALGALSPAPFALIGLNLGLRLGAQGAAACANLLFLSFCMLGGLWIPLSQMPAWMTSLAWILPSYHLGALSLDLAGLTAPTALLGHIAVDGTLAWRREDA
jgi:ABC-2 type transport system permease protein